MADSHDVLIVGAGIVGAACALELANAGVSVGVIDRAAVGSGATAAGMGQIVAMDDSPEQLLLTRYSQLLWDRLALDLSLGLSMDHDRPSLDYDRYGTIWVAVDETEMRAVRHKKATYDAHRIPSEALDERSLYTLEPNLRAGLAGGLLVPGDSVVYPPAIARVLLQQAMRRGASLYRGAVVRLAPNGVQLSDGAVVMGSATVIATGADATDLLPELPVRPKKGHLAITDRYPGFIRHQLVELAYVANAHAQDADSVSFNVQPRGTGQLLVGSSRQIDTRSRDVDYPILSTMLATACAYLPGLAALSCIRVWTGVRAATPDGLPLIGPCPDRSGVWLATGHEGLGITTSLGTAALLAAQMFHRTPEIPIEPYLPSRPLAREPAYA